MELKTNRLATAFGDVKNSGVSIFLLGTLVVVLCGCRSTDVTGGKLDLAESLVENTDLQSGAVSANLPADTPSQRPSYAQNVDDQNSQIRLASNESQGATAIQRSPAKQNLVTLRTLAEGDDFQEIVRAAPGPVLLDFYADWCGPCRKQGKVLHSLESFAAANQAQIIKVDVEQHKDIAKQFDVASLPTLVVLKNGETVDRKVGLTDESRLREMLR